jgi:antitoxin component of MazEF toxin-antitoxin module
MRHSNLVTIQAMKKNNGGNTLFVYIPQELCKNAGIERGMTVHVSNREDGALIIQPLTLFAKNTKSQEPVELTTTTTTTTPTTKTSIFD